MRTVALVGSAILPLALWLSVWASPVAACNGGDAPLATGVRGATSIFYARIAGASESSVGFYDLRLKVGSVIRGSGKSHVVRVINPRVCNALKVGDFGVVVIGSVDPYGVGPNDIYNFFYVLGPGGTSASMAAAVLSDLPNTDTTISPGVDDPGGSGAWLAVLGVSTVATLSYLRRRQVVLTSQVPVAPDHRECQARHHCSWRRVSGGPRVGHRGQRPDALRRIAGVTGPCDIQVRILA